MRNCIVCKNDKKIEAFNSSVVLPLPYPLKSDQKIVICENCGFVFSDSENTEENYHKYYETLNKHKKRAADAKNLDVAYYEKIYRLLNLSKDELGNLDILDFGAGDLLMRDIFQKKGVGNVLTFDVGLNMPKNKKFDIIISTHTFEHILDADIILQNLSNYLKPGGQILLSVPDIDGYNDNYGGPYNWFDLEHINHFSTVSLTNFVQYNGFSVINCVRDIREGRPGLFYPEVIIRAVKNDTKHSAITGILESKTSETVLQNYLSRSDHDFKRLLNRFTKIDSSQNIIWGLGISIMRLSYHLSNIKSDFVDSNPKLWGKTFMGKTILKPDSLIEINLKETVFIVTAINFQDVIKSIQERFNGKAIIITLLLAES